MKKQDLVSRIKLQLKSLLQTEHKFMEVKAGDLLLTTPAESLEVGAEIFYVDADGNNAPLNEGEYTLDNGIKIMVAGGKIAGIFEPETELEPEDVSEEEMAVNPESEEVIKDKMASGIDMVEFEAMKERLGKCEMMIEKMMKDKEMMEKKMSEFAALPLEAPIQTQPTENKSFAAKKESLSAVDVMSIRERVRKNR